MKALTLYQPYASLIACGVKTIETRSWYTSYRGPLAIHAAKTVPEAWRDDFDFLFERYKDELRRVADLYLLEDGSFDLRLPVGGIVALAELKQCLPTDDTHDDLGYLFDDGESVRVPDNDLLTGNYAVGRFGWMLANVRALEFPILCKGKQGLWTPGADQVQYNGPTPADSLDYRSVRQSNKQPQRSLVFSGRT